MNNNSGTVKSAEMLFATVNALQQLQSSGVTELAEHLQIPKSSAHKYLKTLEINGLAVKEGKRYRLSLSFLTYAGAIRYNHPLYLEIMPFVHELSNRTEGHVGVVFEEDGLGYLVETFPGDFVFERNPLGTRFKLHQNALGKAILAKLDDSTVGDIIERHGLDKQTELTITDAEELFAELDQIRERGFAINRGERSQEIRAVGSGITDASGTQVGAISIYFPKHKVTIEELETEHARNVLSTIDEITMKTHYK